VDLAVLASPSMPAESFRIAGMANPAISVPAGAHVTIELVNADADMAHGLVIMPAGTARSAMPMMTAAPSFTGAALWFLGKPTAAGMHAGTISFTAATPGSYQYLCPVPGHAQEGMAGTLTVR
jgi:rusticyanin